MKISIICPVYNEEKYIGGCIESLMKQDFTWNESEIILVDGLSSDKTRQIIKEYIVKYPFIKLLDNPRKITPVSLNIAIRAAKNDIIFRIDAHTTYPPNYFSVLSKHLIELKADNVGGICRTLPGGKGLIPVSIAKAMSSIFGMGNSYFRIGAKKIMEVDTVPFGCFRREVFDRIGLFDEELIRNQDDEFNGRIIKNGGKIFLIPTVIIDYFARDKVSKLSQMFYQYGLFKPLVNKKLGSSATVRQFFPLLFVLLLVAALVFLTFQLPFYEVLLAVLGLYLVLSVSFAVKEGDSFSESLIMPILYFVLHVSYGFGYIRGILRFLILKKSGINVETNR
ncbi:MAG: glycosyltransferase family 2 protein [Bacteroidia bacterium]|nr:glycosyltransferase family 2 protein [Bacteroidia bacterium]